MSANTAFRTACMWTATAFTAAIGRGDGGGRAAGSNGSGDAVCPGDGSTERGADSGQQPAGQGAGGTDERHASGSAGQGDASGKDRRHRLGQPLSGEAFSSGIESQVHGAGQGLH